MKLDSNGVKRTLDKFEAQHIPDDHPAVPQLREVFGEHSFFVDGEGLHIVEPADTESQTTETGKVVRLASWSDANRTSLAPHPPVPTDVIVELESAA